MGKDIIGIVGGIVGWIVLVSITLWSFRYFHMKKKVKGKDGAVEYVKRHEFKIGDARVGSAVVHILLFIVITAVCAGVIFI